MSTSISEQAIQETLGRPQTLIEKQIHAWGHEGQPIIVNLNDFRFFREVDFIKCDTVKAIHALLKTVEDMYYTPYEDYDEEDYRTLTHKVFYNNNNGDWVALSDYLEEAQRVLTIAGKIKGD